MLAGLLAVMLGWWLLQIETRISVADQLIPSAPVAITTPSPTPTSAKILFGGDVMLDRSIRQSLDKHGVNFVLEPLRSVIAEYDLVVANLEGPITPNPSRSVNSEIGSTSNYIFTFDPTVVPMLAEFKLLMLNLGNNHINNFGTAGAASTKTYLSQGGIGFFGNTNHEESSAERVGFSELHGIQIAWVNYNQFVPGGLEAALEDIAWARPQADVVIMVAHWDNEYAANPAKVTEQTATRFIDTGVDLIMGAHPHVVQPWAEYRGKRIYYSLGNFVFDQYFQPETQRGLLVGVQIHPDLTLTFTEIPIQLRPNGQTQLAPATTVGVPATRP